MITLCEENHQVSIVRRDRILESRPDARSEKVSETICLDSSVEHSSLKAVVVERFRGFLPLCDKLKHR